MWYLDMVKYQQVAGLAKTTVDFQLLFILMEKQYIKNMFLIRYKFRVDSLLFDAFEKFDDSAAEYETYKEEEKWYLKNCQKNWQI